MPLLGTAALLNWSDVAAADRPEYYIWHVREHMVGRIGLPGFLRGRRYAAINATCDFFQFYELADSTVLESAAYRALAGTPTPLTQRVTARIRNSFRVVARQGISVGAGQSGYLLTVRLVANDEAAAAFDAALTPAVADQVCAMPMIGSVTSYAAIDTSNRIALIEGLSTEALAEAGAALRTALAGGGQNIVQDLFRHEFTVTPNDADQE